jgi:hypothetical protein
MLVENGFSKRLTYVINLDFVFYTGLLRNERIAALGA